MSCFRLRSYELNPPGGYVYPKPNGGYWSAPMIEALAQKMSAWRKANGKDRPSVRECLEDADHYQCQRLGNMPAYCTECNPVNKTEVAMGNLNPVVTPNLCKSCGAPVAS